MQNEKLSHHDSLLIIVAVLLSMLVLLGTGFGFYHLGSKNNSTNPTSSSQEDDQSSQVLVKNNDDQSSTSLTTTEGNHDQNTQDILNNLKGSSGNFDVDKIESQLSSLLSGQNYSTTIELVSEGEVKKTSVSGVSVIKIYLDLVEDIIAGAQTTSISDSALSGLFSGDTSALDTEINKNQNIYAQLKNISTPIEAVVLQRKYLTLFKTSVEVMQAEKTMLVGGDVDYSAIAKAQGLIDLSKEIDQDKLTLRVKYGI